MCIRDRNGWEWTLWATIIATVGIWTNTRHLKQENSFKGWAEKEVKRRRQLIADGYIPGKPILYDLSELGDENAWEKPMHDRAPYHEMGPELLYDDVPLSPEIEAAEARSDQ
eukprot:TRINITY_DN3828_c0_g1_i2.p1 TRINITY_DN3828_c0_g1~~TRINITY_DN3828_c0_g1_i2.p1  ORF type:complete len:112 (-),score=13.36 TRINITY_DN3828_c0_g1_i2:50-385(-)